MNIIGIDPGLNCTGWGIISLNGKKICYLDSGKITTQINLPIEKRLNALHSGLILVYDKYKPVEAAIEETFINKNPQSSLNLCQARGALLLSLSILGVSKVSHYSANNIKKSITGNGHANKDQMMKIILMSIQSLDKKNLTHDESDAIAAALCHTYTSIVF